MLVVVAQVNPSLGFTAFLSGRCSEYGVGRARSQTQRIKPRSARLRHKFTISARASPGRLIWKHHSAATRRRSCEHPRSPEYVVVQADPTRTIVLLETQLKRLETRHTKDVSSLEAEPLIPAR